MQSQNTDSRTAEEVVRDRAVSTLETDAREGMGAIAWILLGFTFVMLACAALAVFGLCP